MRTVKDPVVRKSEIVAASIELFLKNGYEKTTVESIITKLGVAKGCFYHHFSSKDEVFEECIVSLSHSLLKSYLAILENPDKPAKQRLMDYVSYNFELTKKNESLFEVIHSKGFEEVHARVVIETTKQILPTFIQLIEQGQAEGDFQVASAEFSAIALLGAFREIHEHYSRNLEMGLDKLNKLTIDLIERLFQTQYL